MENFLERDTGNKDVLHYVSTRPIALIAEHEPFVAVEQRHAIAQILYCVQELLFGANCFLPGLDLGSNVAGRPTLERIPIILGHCVP